MSIEEDVTEYRAMRPRYKELTQQILKYIDDAPESMTDEEVAAVVDWQVATVAKRRHPAPRRDKDELTERQRTVLAYLSSEWFPTTALVEAIHDATGLDTNAVNSVLRQLESKGKAETQTHKRRMYGRMVTTRYKYRLAQG